ncbi:acyloxyacyl hydrolase [Aquimarina sp. 2201CG14-23]|uniref:acyloxyacyl hydrolase n=1 Tax=Aquimarina mycalae TaxID=3040073 RepID=UPI002477F794|nr:acyloxyacyl hydrolase [Aquimarina sp. 2201CG14-23]MDH7444450.1 acyloxyacyl hydrolase [Aquimarina sp. 2201CG14-23]
MKYKYYYLLILFVSISLNGQISDRSEENSFFIIPEVLLGKTMEANTFFPKTDVQKGFFLSLGNTNFYDDKEWKARLGYPRTGVSIGFTDFGNKEKVGYAYTIMPFVEFGLFKKNRHRFNFHIAFGASYLNRQFDSETNPFNKGITTKVNWSYRSFLYYDIFKRNRLNWRLGLGYLHHSNGHTRLPNQGLNSFLLSVSSMINSKSLKPKANSVIEKPERKRTSQMYFSLRAGIGQNVLSEVFNDKKEVYSGAIAIGKVINKTFKYGGGFYYRFYEHYHDYIVNDGEVVVEQFPHFRDNPARYASNYGLFGTAELFLGHIGMEFEIGLNISKPFYKVDWQISQGETYNGVYEPAELDWYYEIKRTISSRMGLKLYLINTNKAPKNNLFIAAHINANLGQADFSELSLGYVYRLDM